MAFYDLIWIRDLSTKFFSCLDQKIFILSFCMKLLDYVTSSKLIMTWYTLSVHKNVFNIFNHSTTERQRFICWFYLSSLIDTFKLFKECWKMNKNTHNELLLCLWYFYAPLMITGTFCIRFYKQIFLCHVSVYHKCSSVSRYMYFFQVPIVPEFVFRSSDLVFFDRLMGTIKHNKQSPEVVEAYKYTYSKPGLLSFNWESEFGKHLLLIFQRTW